MNPAAFVQRAAPGVALCCAIAGAAWLLALGEQRLGGHAYVADLVLAILLGVALRSTWRPADTFQPGIALSAKTLLEIAVALLGASISFQAIANAGATLVIGIVLVVAIALVASYCIGRAFGLTHRVAVLVACGNSICGNSAIAAVAPVIGADGKEVAPAIAFTAVLGVVVVLFLPLLTPLLGLSASQYGVLAGLTVYAVPQVLAATAPISSVSTQIGTLVKLVRVLMIGPVVLVLSLLTARQGRAAKVPAFSLNHYVPWFIIAFLGLAALRSFGLIPDAAVGLLSTAAGVLALIAMAALGLDVNVREIVRLSVRICAAVSASLIVLLLISLALIHWLAIP